MLAFCCLRTVPINPTPPDAEYTFRAFPECCPASTAIPSLGFPPSLCSTTLSVNPFRSFFMLSFHSTFLPSLSFHHPSFPFPCPSLDPFTRHSPPLLPITKQGFQILFQFPFRCPFLPFLPSISFKSKIHFPFIRLSDPSSATTPELDGGPDVLAVLTMAW